MPSPQSPILPNDPSAILKALGNRPIPILLHGAPGLGKSTLAQRLAAACLEQGRPCLCLSADPGTPLFGLPGTVSLGEWRNGAWRILRHEALCTLDAGRFRLPLILALQRLLDRRDEGRLLLIDSPGVVRGVAGRELIEALCQTLHSPRVLALTPDPDAIPLVDELHAFAAGVWRIPPAPAAHRPGTRTRARMRTLSWNAWLESGKAQALDLDSLPVLGTPPPDDEPAAWCGRQIALLDETGGTLTIGEVQRLDGRNLILRAPPGRDKSVRALLVRDAQRQADGLLGSAAPFVSQQPVVITPLGRAQAPEQAFPLLGRCGPLDYRLVNGVFGDPLLHLRLRHAGRSLLFDLGEPGPLSARLAHQVTDVFISHAHMDHLAGFQWLLRSRLGDFPPCRIFGPPGLAAHVAGFLDSFLWDRIADRGPIFEVAELHGETLHRFRLQAGRRERLRLDDCAAPDGLLRDEPGFRIRARELDHHTPVLAFAFEPRKEIHVRRDRLEAHRLSPGPWLGELKTAIQAGQTETPIHLPDGSARRAADLAADLLLIQPGKRLVYATDLADTPANREQLVDFAHHAHTFFCEAPFRMQNAENARRNGHLTTRACGEIAAAAEVGLLAPFHFSRRYQHDPDAVIAEIRESFPRLLLPEKGKYRGQVPD